MRTRRSEAVVPHLLLRPASRAQTSLVLALLCGVLAAACDRGERSSSVLSQPVESTERLTARVGTPAAAVDAIAQAWCERERRCGRIGAGRAYAAADDCTRSSTARWADELNAVRCELGVDEAGLQRCLGALRAAGCEEEGRPEPCAAVPLCQRPRAPGPVPPPP